MTAPASHDAHQYHMQCLQVGQQDDYIKLHKPSSVVHAVQTMYIASPCLLE